MLKTEIILRKRSNSSHNEHVLLQEMEIIF